MFQQFCSLPFVFLHLTLKHDIRCLLQGWNLTQPTNGLSACHLKRRLQQQSRCSAVCRHVLICMIVGCEQVIMGVSVGVVCALCVVILIYLVRKDLANARKILFLFVRTRTVGSRPVIAVLLAPIVGRYRSSIGLRNSVRTVGPCERERSPYCPSFDCNVTTFWDMCTLLSFRPPSVALWCF